VLLGYVDGEHHSADDESGPAPEKTMRLDEAVPESVTAAKLTAK
jgi:hypothetical protein